MSDPISDTKNKASRSYRPPGTVAVLDLERPTIGQEWWSITNNRWSELRAEAVGENKTKAQTASTTLRKYYDANAIMISDIGKPAPAGCCKSCWDRKKNKPKRVCRVFAVHEDGQSLACAFCRLKGKPGCNANVIPEEEVDSQEVSAAFEERVATIEGQFYDLDHTVTGLYQTLEYERTQIADLQTRNHELQARNDELEKRLLALETAAAAFAGIAAGTTAFFSPASSS
ncbi:hypothetical protein KCU93_g2636, partial [Aureobasidium melanogenum]